MRPWRENREEDEAVIISKNKNKIRIKKKEFIHSTLTLN